MPKGGTPDKLIMGQFDAWEVNGSEYLVTRYAILTFCTKLLVLRNHWETLGKYTKADYVFLKSH